MKSKTVIKFAPYQILLITLLSILQFVVMLDFMIIAPLGDMMMKNLNIIPRQFSLIVSSYAFAAAVAGILAAGFIDRYGRKQVLLFAMSGFIAGTLLCAIAGSYNTLVLARTVTGLFAGIMSAISLTIVADSFSSQQRGRALAFIQMSFAASQIAGIPLGILLAERFGWRSTFTTLTVMSLAVLVLIILKVRPLKGNPGNKTDNRPLSRLWRTLINRNYISGFTAIGLLSVGGFMLIPFVSSYLINNVGISQQGVSMVFLSTGLASVIILPAVGRLSDQVGKYKIFLAGSVITIIGIVIFTHLERTSLLVVITTNIIVMTGLMSRMIPVQSLSTLLPEASDRGAYMSLTESVKQIAGGLGAVIAGSIIRQDTKFSPIIHFDTLGYIICLIILSSFFFVYRMNRKINH